MNKTIWVFLMMSVLIGCGGADKFEVKQRTIDGVVHVYNPAKPLKGSRILQVKEILRIDSLSIDEENPPALHLFDRDKDNNIFICDRRTPRMYRFSNDGKLDSSFLNKGEGPGEFPRGIYSFQILKNNLWLSHSRKLVCFGLDGKFINEWKFDRNITFIEMVDEDKLIGNIYENDLTDQRKRICSIFNRSGQPATTLLEDKSAGFTEIQMQNNGDTQILRFFSGLITNDILHTFDRKNNRIYLYLSNDYRIFRKNLQGKTDLVIHRDHLKINLKEEDKMSIISQIFSRWSAERRELLRNVFPHTFAAINMIGILPGNHIAIRRIQGFQDYVIDVFDNRGRYLYILEPPAEIPGFYRIGMESWLIWVFKELEERDVFILYEMTNLPF